MNAFTLWMPRVEVWSDPALFLTHEDEKEFFIRPIDGWDVALFENGELIPYPDDLKQEYFPRYYPT